MKVKHPDGKELILSMMPTKVETLLKGMGFDPSEVIVTKNGWLVSGHDMIDDEDELQIVPLVPCR